MPTDNITPNEEAINPVNGANELPQNEGAATDTNPQVDVADNKVVEKTFSQKDLDNIAAKARGTAERETQKRILQQLGLKDYDEDMLLAMRQAYENSLTQEELIAKEVDDLNEENINLMVELDEKDYVIQALCAMSGKNIDDVTKIVRMAQGLKTDDNSVEDCIKEVMSMINSQPVVNNPGVNNMPIGQPLNQPSSSITIDASNNPFKAGTMNLTEQGKLWKENPELARRLAGEAGIKLNF